MLTSLFVKRTIWCDHSVKWCWRDDSNVGVEGSFALSTLLGLFCACTIFCLLPCALETFVKTIGWVSNNLNLYDTELLSILLGSKLLPILGFGQFVGFYKIIGWIDFECFSPPVLYCCTCLFSGSREAFVTLATNDTYSLGCLVLGSSLRRSGTTRRLVVMVSKDVSLAMR